MAIVRCPACGKATFVVGNRRSKARCSRCGRPFADVDKLARSDRGSLEVRVREQLYGSHGLNRSRRP